MGRKVDDHSSAWWRKKSGGGIAEFKIFKARSELLTDWRYLQGTKIYLIKKVSICTIDVYTHVVQNQKKIMHDIISFFYL